MTVPPRTPGRVPGRFADRATIAAFAAALCAPFVDQCVRPGSVREPQTRELRNAAPLPRLEWSVDSFTKFPDAFDEYYLDTFGLRDQLIRGHSLTYYYGLGVSPRKQMVLGRDGWWFSTDHRALEFNRGALPLGREELERWQALLEHQRDVLARRGIEYLFVLAPGKETIYADRLPPEINRVGPSRFDQLYDHLRAHSDLHVLDLRPALLDERKHDRPDDTVYFQLGYHWYGRGAYRAYSEIVRELARKFPVLAPLPLSACKVVDGEEDSGAKAAYIEDFLPQGSACFAPAAPRAQFRGERVWWKMHTLRSTVDDPALPRVLLLHDSMAGYIEALFAEHCSRLNTVWSHEFDISSVDEDKPDVVVVLYIEHVLDEPPPRPVALPRELAEAFDGAARRLFVFDGAHAADADGPRAFAREGYPELAPYADEHGAGLAITTHAVSDFVILPRFEVPADGHVILELELDSPAATMLALWSKQPDEARYRRDTRIRRDLVAGRNRVLIELWEPGIDGRLRMRPGLVPGTYILRSFEVRAP